MHLLLDRCKELEWRPFKVRDVPGAAPGREARQGSWTVGVLDHGRLMWRKPIPQCDIVGVILEVSRSKLM